ncbi:MAG: hypothetical protein Rhims3KO_09740 [Hyphomicrobiales bacterium]
MPGAIDWCSVKKSDTSLVCGVDGGNRLGIIMLSETELCFTIKKWTTNGPAAHSKAVL